MDDHPSTRSRGRRTGRLSTKGRTAPRQSRWWNLVVEIDRRYGVVQIAKFGVATGAGFLAIEAILVLGMILIYHTTQIPGAIFASPWILGLTALAFGAGTTLAFVINDRVTFKDGRSRRRKRQQPWLTRWGKFQLACLAGNIIIAAVEIGLLATFSISPAIGHILGSLATYPVTYLISTRFVWVMGPVS